MPIIFQKTRILGSDFFNDALELALKIAHSSGGLFLAPSGPGLSELGRNPHYDAALQNADINLIDSGISPYSGRNARGSLYNVTLD